AGQNLAARPGVASRTIAQLINILSARNVRLALRQRGRQSRIGNVEGDRKARGHRCGNNKYRDRPWLTDHMSDSAHGSSPPLLIRAGASHNPIAMTVDMFPRPIRPGLAGDKSLRPNYDAKSRLAGGRAGTFS